MISSSRVVYATKLFPKLKSTIGFGSETLTESSKQRSCNRELLTSFGFISDSIGASTFVQLPNFRRSLKKLINLVEEELQAVGGQEVLLPSIVPQRLWHKSERIKRDPKCLDSVFQFTDHDDRKLLLGPTFEESITQMMKYIDTSINEQELPLLLYQSSPKFRLESNPKFGIIRSNEFFMNDLYSFDANIESAKKTYHVITDCYDRIFKKLGLSCIKTQGSTGNIGGKYSQEYQLPIRCGQDMVMTCNDCKHSSNIELQNPDHPDICIQCGSNNVKQLPSIELGHTFLLSDTYSKPMNAQYTAIDGHRYHFEMGCFGLGLTRIIGAGIDLLSIRLKDGADSDVNDNNKKQLCQLRWPKNIEPYDIGIVPPARRSRQFNNGSSQFVQRFIDTTLKHTKKVDFLVEDRDKEGIGRRLIRLKSLGIPYIIVIGQKYLDEVPLFELFKLNYETKDYEQSWLNEEQLFEYMTSEVDQPR